MISFLIFVVVVLLIAAIVVWVIEQIPATATFRPLIRAVIIGGVLIALIWTAYQRFGRS